MEIKVLGPGCANCRKTVALLEQVAQSRGITFDLKKVEDIQDIIKMGVMSTPGVAIDGKLVHSGGIPSREKIEQWFDAPAP